jgi:NitT/TauT family transport system ATP-binding protein
VVQDCSFTLEPGSFTVLLGPSGAGKSTLIRLIAGFEKPDAGRILLDGQPVQRPGPDRLVVFQETALFPWMTTRANVLFGPQARGERAAAARADGLLAKVGLEAFGTKYPRQLSGGMQRRAELARALANDPAVMILDDPFRGLDAMTRSLMVEYYAGLFEESRRTTLFVTTDIDEALALADRFLVVSNRPMRVIADIVVDLPRPRRLSDIAADDAANALKERALKLLYGEALRSFGVRAAQ